MKTPAKTFSAKSSLIPKKKYLRLSLSVCEFGQMDVSFNMIDTPYLIFVLPFFN